MSSVDVFCWRFHSKSWCDVQNQSINQSTASIRTLEQSALLTSSDDSEPFGVLINGFVAFWNENLRLLRTNSADKNQKPRDVRALVLCVCVRCFFCLNVSDHLIVWTQHTSARCGFKTKWPRVTSPDGGWTSQHGSVCGLTWTLRRVVCRQSEFCIWAHVRAVLWADATFQTRVASFPDGFGSPAFWCRTWREARRAARWKLNVNGS